MRSKPELLPTNTWFWPQVIYNLYLRPPASHISARGKELFSELCLERDYLLTLNDTACQRNLDHPLGLSFNTQE